MQSLIFFLRLLKIAVAVRMLDVLEGFDSDVTDTWEGQLFASNRSVACDWCSVAISVENYSYILLVEILKLLVQP